MKITMPLTAATALMILSACGDESATKAESPAPERRVEAPATPGKAADTIVAESARKAAIAPGDVAEVIQKAPTPMPEPVNPIIAFKSEDGKLALARTALTMVSPVHDADTDVWSVFVQLDKSAAEDFYTLTTETTGEALAVIVDNMTVSTPVLETAVYGGGFVFKVDNSEVASRVVATLTGEKPQVSVVDVDARDALPKNRPEADSTVATNGSDNG